MSAASTTNFRHANRLIVSSAATASAGVASTKEFLCSKTN